MQSHFDEKPGVNKEQDSTTTKKQYQTPKIETHAPLDPVSTVTYYYYIH